MTVHKNMFKRRISARYLRFNPRAWTPLGQICMRVEIYLCQIYQGEFLQLYLLDITITSWKRKTTFPVPVRTFAAFKHLVSRLSLAVVLTELP